MTPNVRILIKQVPIHFLSCINSLVSEIRSVPTSTRHYKNNCHHCFKLHCKYKTIGKTKIFWYLLIIIKINPEFMNIKNAQQKILHNVQSILTVIHFLTEITV